MIETQPNGKGLFRVGVMLDLNWNLKRHTDVFAGVARYAQQHDDWECIVDDFAADSLARNKRRRRLYDGVIGRISPELKVIAKRRQIPLVNIWFSSTVQGVPTVHSDYVSAGDMIAEHMLARGIRNFLCLIRRGDRAEKLIAERVAHLSREQGGDASIIRLPLLFAHSPRQWRKTRAILESLLRETPIPAGVVTGVDILARHVAQLAHECRLRVPEDVAIVGGYNEPTVCHYPAPTLTSIEFGLDNVGYEAARMMHRLLRKEKLDQKIVQLPPRELIVRQSSDFVYVDEDIVSAAMQFIAHNARRPISVGDVAAAAGASRRTLETRFETHLGRTVAAEIRRVRLDQAKRLLASSDEPIAHIARLTGIGTPQQFARVFRREEGVSPREYRLRFVARDDD